MKLHAVALHVALPFVGTAQLAPQPPQLAGSLVVSVHEAPQRTGKGALQPLEQVPLAHTGVAPLHVRVQSPQVVGAARSASQPLVATPSQFAKPLAQLKPHVEPSQVATAPAGAAQGVQLAPHDDSNVSETQRSPHRWKPARQVKPQAVPSQVASALGGGAHGEQAAPHVAGAVSGSQTSPQRWYVLAQVKSQRIPSHVATPWVGAAHGEHAAPHVAGLTFATHAAPHP